MDGHFRGREEAQLSEWDLQKALAKNYRQSSKGGTTVDYETEDDELVEDELVTGPERQLDNGDVIAPVWQAHHAQVKSISRPVKKSKLSMPVIQQLSGCNCEGACTDLRCGCLKAGHKCTRAKHAACASG